MNHPLWTGPSTDPIVPSASIAADLAGNTEAGTALNAAGLTILIVAVTGILILLVWSYSRLLRSPRHHDDCEPPAPSRDSGVDPHDR